MAQLFEEFRLSAFVWRTGTESDLSAFVSRCLRELHAYSLLSAIFELYKGWQRTSLLKCLRFCSNLVESRT